MGHFFLLFGNCTGDPAGGMARCKNHGDADDQTGAGQRVLRGNGCRCVDYRKFFGRYPRVHNPYDHGGHRRCGRHSRLIFHPLGSCLEHLAGMGIYPPRGGLDFGSRLLCSGSCGAYVDAPKWMGASTVSRSWSGHAVRLKTMIF